MTPTEKILARVEKLLDRVETLLPGAEKDDAGKGAGKAGKDTEKKAPQPMPAAMCWRGGGLEAVGGGAAAGLEDLLCVEEQKQALLDNTRQFVKGYPANHVLLYGPRGTGKSSLVKTLVAAFGGEGLSLIEVAREDLTDLPLICRAVANSDKRFVLFCDDLSFAAEESAYKSLKVLLDGSVSALPENTILYATSNRRHLIPEYQTENAASKAIDGEIHLHESLEEKLSLSERFGIWLSFQPFNQKQYLRICRHWLEKLGGGNIADEKTRKAALQWALQRGSRSGRSAWQFARDQAGKQRLKARP